MTYDVNRLRARVPALADGSAYFDGPGGTQTPDLVATAIAGALTAPLSNRGRLNLAERRADDFTTAARLAGADLLNADPRGVVFGRSMTELCFMLARTLGREWGPGDEVVVTRLDHDANVRPWVRAAQAAGATVRWVPFDPESGELTPADVAGVLSASTKVVAITGASNLIGTRPDLVAIGELVHESGALFVVDGVHLTAHAGIDIQTIGADVYLCSPYKFLGPHLGMLAASPGLLETLHPDKLRPATEQVPERFELGTLPYELLAGVTAAIDMLADLVPGQEQELPRRDRLVRSMHALQEYEDQLHTHLRSGLQAIPGIRLYSNAPLRTPTELFSLANLPSDQVSVRLAEVGINAPAGSFYAIEAAEWLGLGAPGAVRVGLAPYSSTEDVDRLLDAVQTMATS